MRPSRATTTVSPNTAERMVMEIAQAAVTGGPESSDVAELYDVVGFAMLNLIRKEFLVKSRGGTDAAGIKWHKLSKKYLAYGRRFAGGEQSGLKKAAGLGRANRYGAGQGKGLLTKDQQKMWKAAYARNLARLAAQVGMAEAQRTAAKMAWAYVKAHGARTKLEVYGNREVEILRDTGVLFNSFTYGPIRGGVAIKNGVKYAAALFKKRPAWPKDGKLPKEWQAVLMDAVQSGLADILKRRMTST